MLEHGAQAQAQPQTRGAPSTHIQEDFRPNRGAVASVGFFAGWLPVTCCSVGLVPAILSGLGLGTAYFAAGKTLLFGFGWTGVLALVSVAIILVASLLIARPAFANLPREIAVRAYWRTAGWIGLAAGLTFIVWMEVVMPVLYALGVPMGSLFH